MDRPDPDMTGVHIPRDFLSKFYLGRCQHDHGFACSSPESEYTDFNVWDRALDTEELVEWTTCRFLKTQCCQVAVKICMSS